MQYIKYICCPYTYNLCLYFFGMSARKNHSTSKHFPQSLTTQQLLLSLGADPGFDVRGDEIRQGGLDRLRSPEGPGQSPGGGWRGGGGPLMKLLGLEHLKSVSVNDFEAFCDVFKRIKT